MPFKNLTSSDKIEWLNYLLSRESLFEKLTENINNNKLWLEESEKRMLLHREAYSFNKAFYSNIKYNLLESLGDSDFKTPENLKLQEGNELLFSFTYLLRDWSENEEYNEREIVSKFILKRFNELGIVREGKALFIGCGNGRYVVDFSNGYEFIYACDKSLPMIYSIYYLMSVKKWTILILNKNNCRTVEETIQRETLEITDQQVSIIKRKISFSVEDVLKIKLPDNSIQHLYSIYFTDVLPLKVLFKIIDKLLVNEGLFIHFGPLDYFFTNTNEMLSAEEVRIYFKRKNYTIVADEYLSTRHQFVKNSMRYRVYDNWFFVAKKVINKEERISLESQLFLNDAMTLVVTTEIEKKACKKEVFKASLRDKTYHLPEIIYLILKKVKPNIKLKLIFKQLEIENVNEDKMEDLIRILQELSESNFIKTQI